MHQEDNVMVFRKPLALRRAGLSFFLLGVLIACCGMTAAEAMQEPSLLYIEGLALPISLFFLYWSGPDNIRLDGTHHTYERTFGWPWKTTTRFGSFSGIRGVCIISQRERQTQVMRNTVLLLLEKPEFVAGGGIVLGSYGTDQPAHALIEELNRAYGFPIVPYSKDAVRQ